MSSGRSDSEETLDACVAPMTLFFFGGGERGGGRNDYRRHMDDGLIFYVAAWGGGGMPNATFFQFFQCYWGGGKEGWNLTCAFKLLYLLRELGHAQSASYLQGRRPPCSWPSGLAFSCGNPLFSSSSSGLTSRRAPHHILLHPRRLQRREE